VNRHLNLLLEADDADTLSGYLTAKAGQVLHVGDKLDLEGAVAEVIEVDGSRATKTRVTVSDSTTE
jgi:CBS domain containing-hemolysin-like protein